MFVDCETLIDCRLTQVTVETLVDPKSIRTAASMTIYGRNIDQVNPYQYLVVHIDNLSWHKRDAFYFFILIS